MTDKITLTKNAPLHSEDNNGFKFANLTHNNITPTQQTYFLLFKEHSKLIQQFTQTIYLYSNELLKLEQNGGHKYELDWLKNVRQDLIKQTDEHTGIAFILSKLNELERKVEDTSHTTT
jgi:hypothetical protein